MMVLFAPELYTTVIKGFLFASSELIGIVSLSNKLIVVCSTNPPENLTSFSCCFKLDIKSSMLFITEYSFSTVVLAASDSSCLVLLIVPVCVGD